MTANQKRWRTPAFFVDLLEGRVLLGKDTGKAGNTKHSGVCPWRMGKIRTRETGGWRS